MIAAFARLQYCIEIDDERLAGLEIVWLLWVG